MGRILRNLVQTAGASAWARSGDLGISPSHCRLHGTPLLFCISTDLQEHIFWKFGEGLRSADEGERKDLFHEQSTAFNT